MDRGAWWATVHGVAKSRTRPSDYSGSHLVHVAHLGVFDSHISQPNKLTELDH